MTNEQITQLKQLAQKATAGPWTAYLFENTIWSVDSGPPDDLSERYDLFEDPSEATAKFVAMLDPQNVLALLKRLAKAEKDRDELYTFVQDMEWGSEGLCSDCGRESEGNCPGCGYSRREGHLATCYVSNMLFRLDPYKPVS